MLGLLLMTEIIAVVLIIIVISIRARKLLKGSLIKNIMRGGKVELHIYWDDNVTIECRYFDTEKEAEWYVKEHGIENYKID
jgi:hypothetical protein